MIVALTAPARRAPSRRPRPTRGGAAGSAPGRSAARGPGRPAAPRSPRSPRQVRRVRRPGARRRAPSRSARRRSRAASRTAPRSAPGGRSRGGRRGLGLWQEREDAAAVVVHEHDGRGELVEASGDQRVEVVEERDVADDQGDRDRRRRPRSPGPWRRRRRSRWRRGCERTVIARSVVGSQASRSRTGIELPAHRTAPSGRASASDRPGRHPRTARPGTRAMRLIASPATRSASDPVGRPGRFDRAPAAGRRAADCVDRVRVDEGRGHQCRLAPAVVAVDDDQFRADAREHLDDRF